MQYAAIGAERIGGPLMKDFIIKGQLCTSLDPDRLEITENGWLVILDGRVEGVYAARPERFSPLPVLDFGDRLVLPGMTDLHLHAPQFAFRGLGMDLELLEWLNTYTFPEEAKYRDMDYADRAYSVFSDALLHSVTTRACVFATVHVPATLLLMQKLDAIGLETFVGKVNMNRNCPASLREASTVASLRSTRQWLEKAQFSHSHPILTPRFIPSCTDDLLYALHSLREEFGLPVQSHLSENLSEIEWIRELCPSAKGYADAYRRFGLLGGSTPCIMAHCVHSDDREQQLLQDGGVFIAHCPESNANLASGAAPVTQFLERGLRVGLGSDVAGGSQISLLRAVTLAIQVSKLRWRLLDQQVKPLSFEQAFYLATMGGGAFFGKVGAFLPGYAADVVVLDDGELPHPQPLSVRSRLERAVYLAESSSITAKFVDGRRVL